MQLTIDLSALCQNYQFLATQFTGAETGAAVKANAYGLGIERIAPALYDAGCRHFFVATIAEAVELRQILTDKDVRISVLHGLMNGDMDVFIKHQLTPILNHLTEIEAYLPFANQCDAILHVDTGMRRLGVSLSEIDQIDFERWTPLYVMSHLACADEPDHPLNQEQLIKTQNHLTKIPSQNGVSLCNSSGIFLGDDYHFDLARPGIALYGGGVQADLRPMKNVVTWQAEIIQIRDMDVGETYGYGATYHAETKRKIAILSCGYADGLHRILSNQGFVVANGQKCPIIGRVSMDLTGIDITDLSTEMKLGDYVELMGPQMHVAELAKQAQTIDYELLTGLGQRAQRCYLDR